MALTVMVFALSSRIKMTMTVWVILLSLKFLLAEILTAEKQKHATVLLLFEMTLYYLQKKKNIYRRKRKYVENLKGPPPKKEKKII